jgi:hypothetical protein
MPPPVFRLKSPTAVFFLFALSLLGSLLTTDYHHNWIVDNLPAAGISKAGESGALQTAYVKGFPVGYITEDANIMGYTPGSYGSKPKHYIYNHMEVCG